MKGIALLVGIAGVCAGGWFGVVAPAIDESGAAAAQLTPGEETADGRQDIAAVMEESTRRLQPSSDSRPEGLIRSADGSLRGDLPWNRVPDLLRWVSSQGEKVLRLQVEPATRRTGTGDLNEVASVTVILAEGGR
ncbi:MAG: hypothetical protein ACYTDX_08040 [Planctomycetota bacterium]|jgi:hypothetical protein